MALGDTKKLVSATPLPPDLSPPAPLPAPALCGQVRQLTSVFRITTIFIFQKCNCGYISPNLDHIPCISGTVPGLARPGCKELVPAYGGGALSGQSDASTEPVTAQGLPWSGCYISSLSSGRPARRAPSPSLMGGVGGTVTASDDLWELTQPFRKPTESSRRAWEGIF